MIQRSRIFRPSHRQALRGSACLILGLAWAAEDAAALAAQQTPASTAAAQAPVLIRGASVFDGERMLGERDVLLSDGRVAAIGANVPAPAAATVVEGRGRTLLPGLIVAHTHSWVDALTDALAFGVTTSLDMFTEWNAAQALRAEQRAGNSSAQADLFTAGTLVTAPGGHGTQFGIPIPTITDPGAAAEFVAARIAEGYIMAIVIAGGPQPGPFSFRIDSVRLR